ncbi:MAG: DUF3450 family protein [Verrucomicrobiota bacterium]
MTLRIASKARSLTRLSMLPLLIIAAISTIRAQDDQITRIEQDTDRWIEIQSNIASEKNNWKTDKELLEGSIKVLATRKSALEQMLDSNKTASGVFTSNYEKVANSITENEEAIAHLEQKLPAIEERLRTLASRLPRPIRSEVQAQLDKLPKPGDEIRATATTRVQSLIATITAIDQFNNSLTLSHELRPDGNGGEIDVEILYWGLSAGYAATSKRDKAWVLTPAENGWDWSPSTEVEQISGLIALYEQSENPRLVSVTSTIK